LGTFLHRKELIEKSGRRKKKFSSMDLLKKGRNLHTEKGFDSLTESGKKGGGGRLRGKKEGDQGAPRVRRGKKGDCALRNYDEKDRLNRPIPLCLHEKRTIKKNSPEIGNACAGITSNSSILEKKRRKTGAWNHSIKKSGTLGGRFRRGLERGQIEREKSEKKSYYNYIREERERISGGKGRGVYGFFPLKERKTK